MNQTNQRTGVRVIKVYQYMVLSIGMLVSVLFGSSVYAGVGMLGGGESLYNSDLSFSAGNAYWNAQRNKIPSICKRRNANLVQGYEYGYSYFYTVFANVSLAYRQCGQNNRAPRRNPLTGRVRPGITTLSGRASGIGDVQLGVRARLNHHNTAAWEATLIIPTGYDNNSPSRLGRGGLGLGLGVRFASDTTVQRKNSWAWNLGSTFTYFFAGKGNTIRSFATLKYAFSNTNFEQTGDFASLRISNSFGFAKNGVQRTLFFNQVPRSMTNTDVTSLSLGYSHSFANGWSTNARIGKGFFGRNSPIDYTAGWGFSYRWKE